ncbi:O-acetyl-ADP-ribose deacetylase [Marchantia polymorpha subsp. ruderalis]|uniref:Macro domain-containing protein n=2 Tax=Marchantia polymorpha TaxID=3197 RepID=A0A176VG81_MARPO|nr:hypothetical protein AXG93_2396s1490 [Marchantia polymorpha subsp. ruderalis]PTQ33012.1 hypothetical protein MARPO_0093s0078 [Marchantia polymorpha]BBN11399.1 hypothetical protein Mp_5g11550 [Marchantia polymorpha subsp. ruderalis]|eukprot:PTQ33012.1 hypothetical protein MARPO_0093s0078 [Marchantia polymorpha]
MLGPCRAIPFAAFRAYHAVGLFARVGISSSLTAPVVVVGVTGSRSVSAASCCPRLFCPATSYLSDFRTPSLHKLNSWRLAATMHRWAPYFTGSRSMESREDAPAAMKRERGNCFPLSETCKLVLQRGDITKWHVDGQTDAIVNAANPRMLGGGGVDGAIHDNAGPALRKECLTIPEVARNVRCPTGEARITSGCKLKASKVIHTVGPIYPGNKNAEEQLRNAYRNSLALAVQSGVKYIAFPAISCGVYGYPVDEASVIALNAVRENCAGLDEVYFILFDQKAYFAWLEEAQNIFPS